jgi:hypothetical protein
VSSATPNGKTPSIDERLEAITQTLELTAAMQLKALEGNSEDEAE